MSGKDIKMEHPMAGKSRAAKAHDISRNANAIFEKIDKDEAKKNEAEKESLSPSSSKLRGLKELLFVGTLSKSITIDGFVFKLKTLNHHESREVAKRIFRLSDTDKLIESNAIQLAYSLESINGLSVDEAYEELFDESEDDLSTVDKSLKIISSLNTFLTAKLIEEYFNLSSESKEILNNEDKGDLKK